MGQLYSNSRKTFISMRSFSQSYVCAVQVWDISRQPAQLLYSVQTIASVGRIKWRPNRRFHIASCSLLLDHNVNVWDVRRPYIPFACFDEHKDVATCECWVLCVCTSVCVCLFLSVTLSGGRQWAWAKISLFIHLL